LSSQDSGPPADGSRRTAHAAEPDIEHQAAGYEGVQIGEKRLGGLEDMNLPRGEFEPAAQGTAHAGIVIDHIDDRWRRILRRVQHAWRLALFVIAAAGNPLCVLRGNRGAHRGWVGMKAECQPALTH